jgi:hypothetical protein
MSSAVTRFPRDRFFVADRDDETQASRVLEKNARILWTGRLSLRGGIPLNTVLLVVWPIWISSVLILSVGLNRSTLSGPASGDDQRVFVVAAIVALLVSGLMIRFVVRRYRVARYTITDQRVIEVRYSEIVVYPIDKIKNVTLKLRNANDGILKI